MQHIGLPVVALGSLFGGPVWFARSFKDLRTRRLIQNTPTARIRSLAMGLVEIHGRALARSTVRAPFSGAPCVFWEVDIATQSRKNHWNVVHRNSSGQPFFVQDDTGIAWVYPRGAECKVHFGKEEFCLGVTLPECYAEYMSREGLALRHVWRLGAMRFRERLIEEGQPVYVLGTAMPRARAHSLGDEEALEATGTDGVAVERLRALDEEASAVIRRGENEPTFLISQQSERDLTLTLGLRAVAGLVGGPALTLFGLAYVLDFLSSAMRHGPSR
jgi:hypothetical protein